MHDITCRAAGFDHVGPADKGVCAHAAFKVLRFATAIDQLAQARCAFVLIHQTIIGHQDHDGIVSLAGLFKLGQNVPDPAVQQLQLVGVEPAVLRKGLFGIDKVQRIKRPVLKEERRILRSDAFQLLQRLPLIAFVHLFVFGLRPDLTGLHVDLAGEAACFGFDARDQPIGFEPLIHHQHAALTAGVKAEHVIRFHSFAGHQAQLYLLMQREGGPVETLIMGIGFFDIALVPFPNMRGVIADLFEDLGQGDFLGGQPFTDQRDLDLIHTGAHRMATSQERGPGGGAGWFGIHPHEGHAFVGQRVDVGRLDPHHIVHLARPELAKADVVDKNIEDVWRLAVIRFAQLGQPCVQFDVLCVPLLAKLCAQEIEFSVSHDGAIFGHGQRRAERKPYRQSECFHWVSFPHCFLTGIALAAALIRVRRFSMS